MSDPSTQYRGLWLNVETLRDSRGQLREYARTVYRNSGLSVRFAVAFLVHIPEIDSFIFVQQERVPVRHLITDSWLTEVPAGHHDNPGEDFLEAIIREGNEELKPEFPFTADQVEFVNNASPLAVSPAKFDEALVLAILTAKPGQIDVSRASYQTEVGENLRYVVMKAEDAFAFNFQDLKTLALVREFEVRRLRKQIADDEAKKRFIQKVTQAMKG